MDADATAPIQMLLSQLPLDVKGKLCKCLENADSWKKLVQTLINVEIKLITIKRLEKEIPPSSPAQKLVEILQTKEFTILDTFKVLALANLPDAMKCLEKYVDGNSKKAIENGRKHVHNPNISYIYELPDDILQKLCNTLESSDNWKDLLGVFQDAGFVWASIGHIEKACQFTPSREFMRQLADRNFKISLLYIALAAKGLLLPMTFLESFVSETVKNEVDSLLGGNDNAPKLINVLGSTSREVTKKSDIPEVQRNIDGTQGCISYSLLEEITGGWSQCIKGKFFHGTDHGNNLAIKKIELKALKNKDVLRQLHRLSSANHTNILKMLNFVEGDGVPCLIYPYKANKSLYDVLSEITSSVSSGDHSSGLSWEKKEHIVMGVGNALSYLHEHFSHAVVVKSSDIMLDDNYKPKVADPCLPCLLEQKYDDLSSYLPLQDRQDTLQECENLDCFCLSTIILELLLEKPATEFHMHPSKWICNKQMVVKVKKVKKILKDFCSVDYTGTPGKKVDDWIAAIKFCYEFCQKQSNQPQNCAIKTLTCCVREIWLSE